MTMKSPTRRSLLLGGAALGATALLPLDAQAASAATGPKIHVAKDPGCGCCTAWIEILEGEGFEVTVEHLRGADLGRRKIEKGIPPALASCHTAEVEGYVIEGHVPLVDIRRLLEERPEAVGLSVPGMPYGSPGMGPESKREAYEVRLVLKGGKSELFTAYDAA